MGSRYKAPSDRDPLMTRLAARMEPHVARAFRRAARSTASQVDVGALAEALRSGSLSQVEVAALLDRVLPDTVKRLLDPLLGRTFALGVSLGAELIGVEEGPLGFDLKNPLSIAWVREHGAELVTELTDSTRAGVRALVLRSQEQGIAPTDLAEEIRRVVGLHSRQIEAVAKFRARLVEGGESAARVERRVAKYADALLDYRAMNIARTETINASSAGQEALWQAAANEGLLDREETTRVWSTAQDDRVDIKICESLDEAETSLDAPFEHPNGEAYFRPPAHPGCRCAVVLRFQKVERRAVVPGWTKGEWNEEDPPRDEDGRFGSGGGGGGDESGGGGEGPEDRVGTWRPMEPGEAPKTDWGRPDAEDRSPRVVSQGRDGKSRLTVLDGNHRVRFWKRAGFKFAPAWVLDYRESVGAKPRKHLEQSEADWTRAESLIKGAPHEYASTQVELPEHLAEAALAWARDRVADGDLAEGGRELHPHVTVRYGLDPGVTAERVAPLLRGRGPVHLKLGDVRRFRQPDADVLYASVQSDDLVALHDALGALPHEDTQPAYVPHLTLAYVRPGCCPELDGDLAFFDAEAQVGEVLFMPADGSIPVVIRLVAEAKEFDESEHPRDDAGRFSKAVTRRSREAARRTLGVGRGPTTES